MESIDFEAGMNFAGNTRGIPEAYKQVWKEILTLGVFIVPWLFKWYFSGIQVHWPARAIFHSKILTED